MDKKEEPKKEEPKKEEPKKEEPKKEEVAKKEEAKGNQYLNLPKTGDATTNTIFQGLTGVNEHVAILSYLHWKDLIKVAKTCRMAFQFIIDEDTRKRILSWKPDKDEETRINNYILSLIQAIDIKE